MELIELNPRKEHFSQVSFACKAVDTKSARYSFLFSTGKELIGADSKRLHIVSLEYAKGFYRVVKATKKQLLLHYEGKSYPYKNMSYPDLDKFLKTTGEKIKTAKCLGEVVFEVESSKSHFIRKILEVNEGIQEKYMIPLKGYSWEVYKIDYLFCFASTDNYRRIALVAPIILERKDSL